MSEHLTLTKDTSEKILKSCIDQIDTKLGAGYAKKNPQLLAAVVDLNKAVYQSLQIK